MKQDWFKRSLSYVLIFCLIVNPALAAQPIKSGLDHQSQKVGTVESATIAAEQKLADIKLDASVKAAQTTLKNASNGTQVVDIATPTAAGISHNLFSEFNVGSQGLIFNNSATPVLTQLGGWSDGNRRLAGGSANIILNEVTGLGSSNLLGQIEIAGQSAEFILANPNGISCNGCGFINTPRVSMITGRVKNGANGELGFDIGGGSFRLDGAGLNAANLDSFDIVTRVAQINAQLYAQKLNLYTGVNHYDYATGKLTATSDQGSAGSGIALDVSSLGGMYANSIRLIGTEKGMGVNSQGLIQSVTDLELTADGSVKLKDAIANEKITIKSENIDVNGKLYAKNVAVHVDESAVNIGLIGAQDSLQLAGKNLIQKGEVYAGLNADFSVANTGSLSLAFKESIYNSGIIHAAADAAVITTELTNDQGRIIFEAEQHLSGLNTLNNSGAIYFNGESAGISASTINNVGGDIVLAGNGLLDVKVAGELDNNSGNITANHQLTIATTNLVNLQGNLSASQLSLSTLSLDNSNGSVSANTLAINGDTLVNASGHISAYASQNDSLTLNIKKLLDNSHGNIATNSLNLVIASDAISNAGGTISLTDTGSLLLSAQRNIDNAAGRIEAGTLAVTGQDLDNTQGVMVAKDARLTLLSIENTLGLLQGDFLDVFADSYSSKGGMLIATSEVGQALLLQVSKRIENTTGAVIESHSGDLLVDATQIDNLQGNITLLGAGNFVVKSQQLDNQLGTLAAERQLTLQAGVVNNNLGQLIATSLEFTGNELDNTGGVISTGELLLVADRLNNSGGNLVAQKNITATLDSLLNIDGFLQMNGSGSIIANDLDNSNGSLLNSGSDTLAISAKHLTNIKGNIQVNAALDLQVVDVNNDQGELGALGGLVFNGDSFNNTSGSVNASRVSLIGKQLVNSNGVIASKKNLLLVAQGELQNDGGELLSGQDINVTASAINNDQGLINTKALAIVTQQFSNQSGYIQADQLDLHIPSLNNRQGTIYATSGSGSGLRLQVDQLLDNTGGTLANSGRQLSLIAGDINNQQGSISHVGEGDLLLQAGAIDNRSGSIYSANSLSLGAQSLSNDFGSVSASDDLAVLVSGNLTNIYGQITAAGRQVISSTQLNNFSGLISAKQLSVSANIVDNTASGRLEGESLSLNAQVLNNVGVLLATASTNNSLQFNVAHFINSGLLETYSRDLLLQNIAMESHAGQIVHHGQGQLYIVSDGLFDNHSGLVSTNGTLVIDATAIDNSGGQLIAGQQLAIDLTSLNNRGGLLQSSGGLNLHLNEFDNSHGGQLVLGGDSASAINIIGLFDNSGGSVSYWGEGQLSLSANQFANRNGSLGGDGAIAVTAISLDNSSGFLGSHKSLTLTASELNNDDGEITAGKLALHLHGFDNNGIVQATSSDDDSFVLNADYFNNRNILQIFSNNLLLDNANINNSSGLIIHRGTGNLVINQEQLINQQGLINSQGSLIFHFDQLDNSAQGELVAAKAVEINAVQLDNSQGLIEASGGFTLNVAQIHNGVDGNILSLGAAETKIITEQLVNIGTIAVNHVLDMGAREVTNAGVMQAKDGFSLVTQQLSNEGELLSAQLLINATSFTNAAEALVDAGSLNITGDQLTNHGLIQFGNALNNTAISNDLNNEWNVALLRNDGRIEGHGNDVEFRVGSLNNENGQLAYQGEGRLSLGAQEIHNHLGIISAAKLQVQSSALDNTEGKLVADVLTLAVDDINNQSGLFQVNKALQLTANSFDNRQGILLAQGPEVSSVNANLLDNTAGQMLFSHAQMHAGELTNYQGQIIADDFSLHADSFNNREGVLASSNISNPLELIIAHTLNNIDGLIQGDNLYTNIQAQNIDNTGGSLLHKGAGSLQVTAETLLNGHEGEISSGSQIDIQVAGSLTNDGDISAFDDAQLNVQQLNNQGSIVAGQHLLIAATNLVNGANDAAALISADWVSLTLTETLNLQGARVEARELQWAGNSLINRGLILSHGQADQSLDFQLASLSNSGVIETAANNISLENLDNSQGHLVHTGIGNLLISGEQLKNNQGAIESDGKVHLQTARLDNTGGAIISYHADGITAQGGELVNEQGYLSAENIVLDFNQITNRDGDIEGDKLRINAADVVNSGGRILASFADISAQIFTNNNSNQRAGLISVDQLRMSAQVLNNNQAKIQGGELLIRGGQLNNDQGTLLALDDSLIQALNLDFIQGITNHEGLIESHSLDLTIQSAIDNTHGNLLLTGEGLLQLRELNNNQGIVHSNGDIQLGSSDIAAIDNSEGNIVARNDISLAAQFIDNSSGSVVAANRLQVAAQQLDNSSGLLLAQGESNQSLDILVQELLDNSFGVMETNAENFSLDLTHLRNGGGEVRHQGTGDFLLVAQGDAIHDEGLLATRGNMIAAFSGSFENRGTLSAERTLSLSANAIQNNRDAFIYANNGSLSADHVGNAGAIEANRLTVAGEQLDNRGGNLRALSVADNSLVLNVNRVDNSEGGLIEVRSANLDLAAQVANQGGTILHWGEGRLSLGDLFNTNGQVFSAGDLLVAQQQLDNSGGLLQANHNLNLQVGDLSNQSGSVFAGNLLQAQLSNLNNSNNGEVIGVNGFDMQVTGRLDNQAGQLSTNAEHMLIHAAELQNADGRILHQGNGQLDIFGIENLYNTGGQIASNGELSVVADNIFNGSSVRGSALLKADHLSLVANYLDNNGGRIQGNSQLSMTLPAINNQGGQIVSLGEADDAITFNTAELGNQSGEIEIHSRNLDLSSITLNNQDGVLTHWGEGILRIFNQQELRNQGGFLQTAGAADVHVAAVNNQNGTIIARDLTVAADQVINNNLGVMAGDSVSLSGFHIKNREGLIAATGNSSAALVLDSSNVIDNRRGVIRNAARNWSLNLDRIDNTGGSLQHQGGGEFSLNSESVLVNKGTISSTHNILLNLMGLDNQGNLIADNALAIYSEGQVSNSAGGLIKGGESLLLRTEQGLSNSGEISARNSFNLSVAGQLNNAGTMATDAQYSNVSAAQINNNGTIAHNGSGRFSINTAALNNSGNLVSHGEMAIASANITNNATLSAAQLSASGFADFQNGGRLEAGSAYLQGSRLHNYGELAATGSNDSFIAYVNELSNFGSIVSNSFNQSFHGALNNSGEFIHAGNGQLNLGDAGVVNIDGGVISTAGTAQLSRSLLGAGQLFATSGIQIGGSDTFENQGGTLYTQGEFNITTSVNNNGTLISDDLFRIATSGVITNRGVMQGASLDWTVGQLLNQGGKVIVSTASESSIVAHSIDNSDGGWIEANGGGFGLVANQGDINNHQGDIRQNGGRLALNASGRVLNNQGDIHTDGGLTLTASSAVDNSQGELAAGSLTATVRQLNNNQGILLLLNGESNSNSRFAIAELNNNGGIISSNGQSLLLQGLSLFDNTGGLLNHYGNGALTISSDQLLDNLNSKITTNGDLSITTHGDYSNHGELVANGYNTISATNFSNSNLVQSKGAKVVITAQSGSVTNLAGAQIDSYGDTTLNAILLNNQGVIHADQILDLQLQSFSQAGNLSAGSLLKIHVNDSVVLSASDHLFSDSSLDFTSNGSLTNNGAISSERTLKLTAMALTNGVDATITGGVGGTSELHIANNFTNYGRVSSGDWLSVNAGNINNYNIISTANGLNLSGGSLYNDNVIFSGGYFYSNNSAITNQGGTLYSIGNMDLLVSGIVSNSQQGSIEAGGKLKIHAASILNQAGVPSITVVTSSGHQREVDHHDDNSNAPYMEVTDIDTVITKRTPVANGDALIASNRDMELNANYIENLYGNIFVGGNLNVSGGRLNNKSAEENIHTETTKSVSKFFDHGSSYQETVDSKDEVGAQVVGGIHVTGNITGNLAEAVFQIDNYQIGGYSSNTSFTSFDPNLRLGDGASAASANYLGGGSYVGSLQRITEAARTNGGHVAINTDSANSHSTNIGGQQQLAGVTVNSAQNQSGNFTANNGNQTNLASSYQNITSSQGQLGELVSANEHNQSQQHGLVGQIAEIVGTSIAALKNTLGVAAVEQLAVTDGNSSETISGISTNAAPVASGTGDLHQIGGAASSGNGLVGQVVGGSNLPGMGDASLPGSTPVAGTQAQVASGSGVATAALPQQLDATVIQVLPQGFSPANAGSLFIRNNAPDSHYLIETRPEFTDYQRFLGSDYLLNSLGYNPDKTTKRLGDAFYENQLVRDALMRQTSQRYIGGATNDFEQMQQLMDNAVAANSRLQLSVGIALTAEQAAALTENIIWLVEAHIDGQTLLVPQLYLAAGEKAQLLPNGTVISAGGKIDLFAKDSISTQGSIYAGNGLSLRTDGKLDQQAQLNSKVGIELIAGQDLFNNSSLSSQVVNLVTRGNFTNTASGNINGDWVSIKADGDINNLSQVSATNVLLMDAGNRLINSVNGRLISQGLTSLSAQNDVINQQGYIEGQNVALMSRAGSVINRTESTQVSTTDARGRTQTNTVVGPSSTIVSHQNLLLSAGKDLDLRGSNFAAANDIDFSAGNDILLNAVAQLTETDASRRGKVDKTSRTEFSVVKINAGNNLALNAGRDLNAEGTEFTGKSGVSLLAGRDINLSAVTEQSHSEHQGKRKKVIDTETRNQLVTIESGGNVQINAGQDANLVGTNITAAGNISLTAARDTNISAVVDSDYHYDYSKKKKSFGRSKTKENETLDETIAGGEISAGGNLLINAHANDQGALIGDASGNVNLLGAKLSANGAAVVSADEDVNVSGIRYNSLDYHRTQKSGVAGLSKKDKGGAQTDQLLQNAEINSQRDVVFMANNLKLVAVNVVAKGDIDLNVVDELLVSAGDVSRSAKNWNSKSGLLSNDKLYSKTVHREGEQESGVQASLLQADGKISGHVGSGDVIGSDLNAKQGVFVIADIGDLSFHSATTRNESYTKDENLSVGLGDLISSLSRPDQLVKSENGRASVKLADAHIEKYDSKTTSQGARNTSVVSDGSIILKANAGKVDVAGADLAANASKTATGDDPLTNGSLLLSGALGVNLGTVDTSKQTEKHSLTGDAELSVVVQHQAVEVVMATKNLDDAKDKLSQAKKDYKNYERDLDGQKTNLRQLEADYANQAPGVTLNDLNALRNRVSDLEQDKAWYQAGLAMAATNLASATTALVQQIAAAAQSTGTYGFNAGVQLDIDASKSTTKTVDTHQQGNTLSGKNIILQTGAVDVDGKLITKGTAVNIQGSSLVADEKLSIITGDLNIFASADTHQLTDEREHGHVTAQMTVYGASGGASINGSFDRSRAKESSTSYNNSLLLGNVVDITTSGDANIRGANIHADTQLDVNIAGNLTLESVQDRSTSKNNSFGVSGGMSFDGATSKEKNGQRLAAGEKVLNEGSSAYNLHDQHDVKGVSGASGSFNISNGYSDSKETIVTSLTSGGAANIHIGGHTQLNGALLATVDEDGNDLGSLNFTTKTLGFSDLTNTNTSHQMAGGFSTNLSIGGQPNLQQQNNTQNDEGDSLNKGTSHITYKNTSTDYANKTLATLGFGNITVGDVQIEQDGKPAEAASTSNLLANLNRDTSNTNKELWSINRAQGNIDANVDNRFLTSNGWKDIGHDIENLTGNFKSISHNVAGAFKDQTSTETIKDNYKFALINQGKMDEATANNLVDNLTSTGYFDNQSAIAKALKANGDMDIAQLRNLSVDNTFTLQYNQQLQQAQLASGDVLVTAGASNALGVVVTDSAAMLNRAINELPEDQRKAGGEAFSLLTSGPTGYIISKGAERGMQYLPDTAKQALGKFGEKVDAAATGLSEAGVGFLVSDENKNVSTYYEGTQENREGGQDVATDRVDGTKMVVSGIISATGATGIWKSASRDGGAIGGAAKDGKGKVDKGSKEKQPGLEDNEAGHSEFGGNGGRESIRKPIGKRTVIPPKSDKATNRSLQRENDSADILAKNGYQVEQNPKTDGIKNPDYKINGEIFDNYAPSTSKPRNIWSEVDGKIQDGQTKNVVVNLADSAVDLNKLKEQFDKYPIVEMDKLIVIDANGAIIRLK